MKNKSILCLLISSLLFSWQSQPHSANLGFLAPKHQKKSFPSEKPAFHHPIEAKVVNRFHSLLIDGTWNGSYVNGYKVKLQQREILIEIFRMLSQSRKITETNRFIGLLEQFDPTLKMFLSKRLQRRIGIILKLPESPLNKLTKIIEAIEQAIDTDPQPILVELFPPDFLKYYLKLKDWVAEMNKSLELLPSRQRAALRLNYNGTFKQAYFTKTRIHPAAVALIMLANIDKSPDYSL